MILVTGATGFLGGRLTQVLAQQDNAVRILIRPGASTKSDRLRHLDGLSIEITEGSLEDFDSLKRATKGCKFIYHCGATSTDWAPWQTYYNSNVLGVRNILKAAREEKNLERFVHISTSDVYGYPELRCDETHPMVDVNLPYNRTKIGGEKEVWAAKELGLPVTVIRPVSIYGPRSKDFVLGVAQQLKDNFMGVFGGGNTCAGLIFVDNAVDFIIHATQSSIALGQAYNLRDETDETWRQYLDTLANGLGYRSAYINFNPNVALFLGQVLTGFHEALYGAIHIPGRPLITKHVVYVMSRDQGYLIDKAKRDLGFKSTISFDQGMERTLDWLYSINMEKKERH